MWWITQLAVVVYSFSDRILAIWGSLNRITRKAKLLILTELSNGAPVNSSTNQNSPTIPTDEPGLYQTGPASSSAVVTR